MVAAAVAERELERLQPDRAAEQLMAEADAEHRLAPDELAQRVDDVVQGRRVAGAVGEEDRVGVAGEQLVGTHRAGMKLDDRAALDEVAHDRALDAGVDRGDARTRAADRGTVIAPRRHDAGEVGARIDGSARTSAIASPMLMAAGNTPPRIEPASRM